MPTPANAVPADHIVSLLLAGKVHQSWSSYEIDSDLLTPADAWQLQLGLPDGRLPPALQEGAAVQLRIGRDLVLTGRIDDIEDPIEHGTHTLTLRGRDGAAILVDCSSPIFTRRQATLAEIVADVVRPLGLSQIRIAKDGSRKPYRTGAVRIFRSAHEHFDLVGDQREEIEARVHAAINALNN